MKISSMLVFLLPFLFLLLHPSHSTTVLVDGVSEWKNATVHVGDSIIFNNKYHYKVYIFRNQSAFNLCNFTQATLLTKPNSTSYTWHPSRPGLYYFTFNNDSLKSCQASQKLSIKVSPATSAPESSPMLAPAPTSGGTVSSSPAPPSGGMVSSSPAYPWPSQPHEAALPSPAPSNVISPVSMPTIVPDKGGGIPFINSNPAVPLPTGEVDSATILPLSSSDHGRQVMVGLLAGLMTLFSVVLLMP
ncbi:hypothetical protein SLEP1_g44316 [Rubroshorea leprosula]|uniref:Cupredoxin n=1 Tax=Rubroshorea leprosula TaxID=152421 RepID=A0AAV5LFT7_9ROSI|nr:hypothetical protein SLEP1_g44316 [Rubroshorea leprosula]